MMTAMAATPASPNRRGRPSKGDRKLAWGRLPSADADRVEELAASRGLYKSDVVAALVAVGLAHLEEAGLPEPREELHLTA
jgi:hypothetical protein